MKQEENPFEELLGSTAEAHNPGEIVIGWFCGLSSDGQALVDFSQNPGAEPLTAISTQPLVQGQKGRQVALMFADGDFERPLILGFIHSPLQEMLESYEFSAERPEDKEAGSEIDEVRVREAFADEVTVDGKKITLEAADEIVLKCGKASITLTRAGKILIRGAYLLNRSSGVNRIVGGSVQVN